MGDVNAPQASVERMGENDDEVMLLHFSIN